MPGLWPSDFRVPEVPLQQRGGTAQPTPWQPTQSGAAAGACEARGAEEGMHGGGMQSELRFADVKGGRWHTLVLVERHGELTAGPAHAACRAAASRVSPEPLGIGRKRSLGSVGCS